MKYIWLALFPILCSAATPKQILVRHLMALVPEGYSNGRTLSGTKCKVIFHSVKDMNHTQLGYARAQVVKAGQTIDIEFFFDLEEAQIRRIAHGVQAALGTQYLSARRLGKGIEITAENTDDTIVCILR
ncbi:MAG: hypothetical protein KF799_08745 [Bdellovibrionales bacterium]|nr:hypothetical protein [Bdellovibrionales bacterium]